MKIYILVVILFLIICVQAFNNAENKFYLGENVQAQTITKVPDACVTMDFYYLVTENVLYSPKVRHIEVFLDEKTFSEKNLEKLFRYLSDKNPMPKHLTVVVSTDWQQLSLPSDCPIALMSEEPDRPDKYDYHQATFYRRDRKVKSEVFEYYPELKTDRFKTVVLK